MEIIYKKLNEIKPYERNPRKNDEAVKYVANSIKEFGFKVPIVIDKEGVIVAGHTRYKASINLEIEKVPCIIADDLTDEQIKAYRLADNKVSEKSEWDSELLSEELDNIFNIDMSEFDFDLSLSQDQVVEDECPEVDKDKQPAGNELGCIRGLLKKKLITQEKSNDLISSMQLCNYAYRTRG